jgi:signal transduction histidine kinase
MENNVVLLIVISGVALASIVVNVWLWLRNRRNTKKVVFLFNALDNGDYTFRFLEGKGLDSELNAALNRMKEILQHARDQQKEKEKYFEFIIDSIDTGILVVDKEHGYVIRSNRAALKMLDREAITHLDQVKEKLKNFAVRESNTVLAGRRVRILGFSDIKGELANQETDSWVRLIRVLTHEIMNTLTPVISLSETLLERAEGEQKEGLQVINQTSKDLIRFVENYRKFIHLPQPQPELFYVKPFMERMAKLAQPLADKGQTLEVEVAPADLLVYADESLIARVVSNLVKNAVEATHEGQHIWLKAFTGDHDEVVMEVADDGETIPAELADHIFIPFFTTKKEGSGIGLSVSRQIMRMSNGSLTLVNDEGKGPTTFRLTFA